MSVLQSRGATRSYLDRDSLNPDELWTSGLRPFDFQAEFNRLLDSNQQFVERAGLSMATVQLGDAGDVVTLRVSFNHDVESTFHGSAAAETFPTGGQH